MSDAADIDEDTGDGESAPKSKKGLILVLVIGLLAGAGSFGAVWSGLLDSILGSEQGDSDGTDPEDQDTSDELPEPPEQAATPGAVFHPLDPISVSIGVGGSSRQLRVGTVLEVPAVELDNIMQIAPRLQDGLLSYLRALEPETVEDPTALLLLRSQMLRRARLIAGSDVVLNLLVTDFVLN